VPQPPTIAVEIVEADSDSWFSPDPSGGPSRSEADLDVQLVYGMAPGAAIRFFKAGLTWSGTLDKCLHDMANFTPSLTVASCSLGFNRSDTAQSALDHLAAKGCSFMTVSGDDGCTADPDTSLTMNNQTLVGGTVLYCTQIKPNVAPANYPTPYYNYEDGWVKSGGGVLRSADIPPYQMTIMDATAGANGGSTQYRNYPDVAMAATGIAFVRGHWGFIGGTSCATPLFAGFIALANEYSEHNKGPAKQGFLNSVLYAIAETAGQPGGADLYSQCFNDISDGDANTGSGGSFRAVAGRSWLSPSAKAEADEVSTPLIRQMRLAAGIERMRGYPAGSASQLLRAQPRQCRPARDNRAADIACPSCSSPLIFVVYRN
jgi:hypothetical protein